ncbi:GNAT family N-acetyltransferase [Rhodospirillales bacterium]|nr:GNAT family N-acetyltransferase [Rhodospirillales bacterium]
MDDLKLRQATRDDLDAMVALLADDKLGAGREKPSDPAYAKAFSEMENDPNNELWVIEGPNAPVLGVLQLTFIPGLSRIGAKRAMIESVRVADELQGRGVGRWFFTQMIARAREQGAVLLQLTSDKTRPDAIRFYESLGFIGSHEGFKLKLD